MIEFIGPDEMWRPIPWAPGYDVSCRGRVRTWRRRCRCAAPRTVPQVLPGRIARRGGYRLFTLSVDGKAKHVTGHVLVLSTFAGPRQAVQVCCHSNGVRTDNRWPENLRWDTAAGNSQDAIAHGTTLRGEAHRQRVLRESQALEAIALVGLVPQPVLAKWYGVSDTAIRRVHSGENWAHLPRHSPPIRSPQSKWWTDHGVNARASDPYRDRFIRFLVDEGDCTYSQIGSWFEINKYAVKHAVDRSRARAVMVAL